MPLASLTPSIAASAVPAHNLGSVEMQALPSCPCPAWHYCCPAFMVLTTELQRG